jgi:hypothetical protein
MRMRHIVAYPAQQGIPHYRISGTIFEKKVY